jgi:flagellin
MASILTNAAATAALQTLRHLSGSLEETQRQVSSGLRVKQASDNAAYWSIATTMRSDNLALSAVRDALALGGAKLDVAYAATENVVEILKEFKARLVTASEAGVDRTKIQEELSHLNAQAESTVTSASFSGVNWLSTTSPTHIQDLSVLSDNLVTAFVRGSAGAVAVKTAEVDLRESSMLNAGGGGILQKDLLDYYMPLGPMYRDDFYHEGHQDHIFRGPVTFDASEVVSFDLTVDRSDLSDGETYSVVVDKSVIDAALASTDGVINNVGELRRVLQQAFDTAGAGATATMYGTYFNPAVSRYGIDSRETSGHPGSSIYVEDLTGPYAKLGLGTASLVDHDNMHPYGAMSFVQPFKLYLDATIEFDISINNSPMMTYTIDRDVVDAALGSADGMINSASDLQTVIEYLTSGIGVAVDVSGDQLKIRADQTVYPGYGSRATPFAVSSFRPDPPFTLRFDLSEIDVTSDTFTVAEYLEGVEHMLKEAISSASTLGALKSRVDLQDEFAGKLIDSIDSGVGRLVDANMNEASTRLKALQTQEQLAIQSLSIANTNSENILSLFRQ